MWIIHIPLSSEHDCDLESEAPQDQIIPQHVKKSVRKAQPADLECPNLPAILAPVMSSQAQSLTLNERVGIPEQKFFAIWDRSKRSQPNHPEPSSGAKRPTILCKCPSVSL
jgi:hypothetical protein